MGGIMAEIKKDAVKPEADTKQSTENSAPVNRIGLVEIIMITMLVGLVFVFVFPFKQMTVDKGKEAIARTRFEEALPIFEKVSAAADAYKKQDEFAAYPIIIDEMNLGNINTEYFRFEYTDAGPTITAISTEAFGKADVKVSYNMASKSFSIEDADPKTVPTVKEDWLP